MRMLGIPPEGMNLIALTLSRCDMKTAFQESAENRSAHKSYSVSHSFSRTSGKDGARGDSIWGRINIASQLPPSS
jgi:hypothetical protein